MSERIQHFLCFFRFFFFFRKQDAVSEETWLNFFNALVLYLDLLWKFCLSRLSQVVGSFWQQNLSNITKRQVLPVPQNCSLVVSIHTIWSSPEACEARLPWVGEQQVTYNLSRWNHSYKKGKFTCGAWFLCIGYLWIPKETSKIPYEPTTMIKGITVELRHEFYSPIYVWPEGHKVKSELLVIRETNDNYEIYLAVWMFKTILK